MDPIPTFHLGLGIDVIGLAFYISFLILFGTVFTSIESRNLIVYLVDLFSISKENAI